jgi:hypothetical protein
LVIIVFFDDVIVFFHKGTTCPTQGGGRGSGHGSRRRGIVKDVINSSGPINAKDADTVHDGQFAKDMNGPDDTIPDTDGMIIIGKVTGGITQQGGDNGQDPFGTRRMGPALQLFPQGHGGHFSLIVHLTTLEPMKVKNRQDTMDGIRHGPTPIEWDVGWNQGQGQQMVHGGHHDELEDGDTA